MAKKMRKLLALMLALTLVTGQLLIPSAASALPPEGSALLPADPASVPAIEPIITNPPADADSSYQDTPTGYQENISYTDPGTGAQVTGQETYSMDPATGVETENVIEKSVDTDTTTIVGTTTITETETREVWQDTTITPVDPVTTPDAEGFTSTGGTKTEVVMGENESSHTMIQDGPQFPIEESETGSGQEFSTTTTTDTKEKTETQSNVNNPAITTDQDFTHDPTKDTDTGWIKDNGEAEQDTYTDADIDQKPGDVTLSMTQTNKTDTETIEFDLEDAVAGNINLPAEGTTEVTNADGSKTITSVTYIKKDGITVGYTKTITTVTSTTVTDAEPTRGQTHTAYDDNTDLDSSTTTNNTTYLMPVKPQGGTVKNSDGTTTVTTVKEITQEVKDANGQTQIDPVTGNPITEVIGYETTKVTTSADGLYSLTESNSIYRTEISTSTTTNVDVSTQTDTTSLTTNQTTTTNSVKYLDAEGFELEWNGVNWVYAAEMGAVTGTAGDVTITPLTPTTLVLDGKEYVLNRSDSSITPVGDHNSPEGYDYNYTGVRGEGSEYEVEHSDGESDAHMFQLKFGDQTFYVYCVDFATTATPNYNYKIENVADATFYDEDASKHIQAIGTYGYWGTTGTNADGTPKQGSLAALKANLKAARSEAVANGKSFPLTEAQIDELTEGEALTATQAAFWTFGNSGTGSEKTTMDTEQQNANITGLYKWLIEQEAPVTDTTEIIDKDEFATKASITVGEKVEETASGTIYNTTVAVTIDVSRSSLTGNLVITLKQGNQVKGKIDLATEESNWLGKLIADNKAGTTDIVFENVELLEGVDFTISMEGVQKLEEGVYIYTSEKINDKPSQTFVGLAQGENNVDLSVNMRFTVTEPEAQVKDPGAKPAQRRTETETHVKKQTETITTVTTDTTVESTEVQKTKRSWTRELLRQWSYVYDLELYEDDGGWDDGNDDGNNRRNIILDEEVPLADAPLTGDLSGLWAAISAISLGSMALLSIKRKEEN